nr:hypothetical protein [Hyphomonas sp. Mor2]
MSLPPRADTGLRLGLIVLVVVTLGFLLLILTLPDQRSDPAPARASSQASLLDVLNDAPTRAAVEALRSSSPATYAELDAIAKRAIASGSDPQALSELVLEALFAQFRLQARAVKSTGSAEFQSIIAGLSDGLQDLKTVDSPWCRGETIAVYLAQNEADLVPSLLAEFPYGTAQYDWAMGWMTTILAAAQRGQTRPRRHSRPGSRDETVLQQTGLALGSEQWALGLQIAAFANSEGTSFAEMQAVIGGMDVCELGIAVDTVSARLPEDVRARIWADLMPEIMIGNTPYVIHRVTDYFFIG